MAVANPVSRAATEVVLPGSESEAVEAFGDGGDSTVVIGGGTIVVPDLTARRIQPARANFSSTSTASFASSNASSSITCDVEKRTWSPSVVPMPARIP